MQNKTEIARYTAIDMLLEVLLRDETYLKDDLLHGSIGLYNMNDRQLEDLMKNNLAEETTWKIL